MSGAPAPEPTAVSLARKIALTAIAAALLLGTLAYGVLRLYG